MWRKRISWISLLILASAAASYLWSGGMLEHWINAMFMIGLLLLVVAGGVYVINGGFFHVFSEGLKRLRIIKEKEYGFEDSLNGETREERKERMARWITSVAFTVGLVDTALSFLLLSFL
ncbi:DUF3899 domain-containing protein [Salinithrix halophila]